MSAAAGFFFDGRVDVHESGKDSLDVGVDGYHVLLIGNTENGGHGIVAKSGQRGELLLGVGNGASVAFKHDFCGLMKKTRAPIVTETFPVAEYFFFRGFGHRAHVRETAHPALKVGNTAFHLRLLKHDFGYPYFIGRVMHSPWQRTLVEGKPGEQGVGDLCNVILGEYGKHRGSIYGNDGAYKTMSVGF